MRVRAALRFITGLKEVERLALLSVVLLSILFSATAVSANDDKIIQFYLNQLGFNSGLVDGQPGKKTKSALNSFYASNPDLEAKQVGIAAKSDLLKKAREETRFTLHQNF